ncbi:MAG: peptidoglycan DD-metalloendopeptidase family protein [Pseudomonadota bacterium]
MTKRDEFGRWLAGQTEPPIEIMDGCFNAKHLRLDAQSLKARGWNDLPIDWVPPNGEIHAGGYLEERGIYDSPVFKTDNEEPRKLHLGVDLFAPAGTPFRSPLDGRVHSFQNNDGDLDYGPTIILEHEPKDGLTFWTLYGHLSAESLTDLTLGKPVSRGDVLAELGDKTINGGWAPHLHFQIILDLQGRSGDFPGVCKVSEREEWAEICPSPYALLGLSLD